MSNEVCAQVDSSLAAIAHIEAISDADDALIASECCE